MTSSDSVWIEESREFLKKHFVTKDLGKPRYFLRNENAHVKDDIALSQRKYVLDLL